MAKKPVWNNTCNRFVAFLDIMGFKDMVLRTNAKKLHTTLCSLVKDFEPIKEYEKYMREKNNPNTEGYKSIVKIVLFSDSIVLVSYDDSRKSAYGIMIFIQWIVNRAIAKGIPLKGALAYGVQTADFKKSLHFGQPLIDAFELQKELKLYGVVLHHTVEKQLWELFKSDLDSKYYIMRQYISNYNTPMKSGNISHYLVDWTVDFENIEDAQNVFIELYNNVSGKPRQYVDNTFDFVRWITVKKAELKQKKTKDNPI
jgi:hypothetical protein